MLFRDPAVRRPGRPPHRVHGNWTMVCQGKTALTAGALESEELVTIVDWLAPDARPAESPRTTDQRGLQPPPDSPGRCPAVRQKEDTISTQTPSKPTECRPNGPRSDVENPNNPAHNAARDNPASQLHLNHEPTRRRRWSVAPGNGLDRFPGVWPGVVARSAF